MCFLRDGWFCLTVCLNVVSPFQLLWLTSRQRSCSPLKTRLASWSCSWVRASWDSLQLHSELSLSFPKDKKWMTLQILSSTPPGARCRLMMACLSTNSGGGKKKETECDCESVFHACKWWMLISPRLFSQQWRVHMVAGFNMPAHFLRPAPLVFLDTGSQRAYEWRHACCRLYLLFAGVLLDFWAPSAVHMLLVDWLMAPISVTMMLIREDWGEKQRRCGGARFLFYLMRLESRLCIHMRPQLIKIAAVAALKRMARSSAHTPHE